jgi:tetratricopeptide (TPR) repeat protein
MTSLYRKTKNFFSRIFSADWANLKSWRPYFIIFIFGFLLYGQTLFFNFTYFDDNALILEQAEVLSSFKNVGAVFSSDAFFSDDKFYYRPLFNLSLMLDNHWGGIMPFAYHFSNILFHLLAAMLIFYIIYRLSRRRELSFFLSLIFLVHPALVQAVAWLPGRNDSLLAVFILNSFIFFLNFLDKPRLSSYIFHILFFLLALLVKETAIVLPLLMIFYVYFISAGALAKTDKLLLLPGYGLALFIWLVMRSLALSGASSANYLEAALNSIYNLPAILIYLGKILFPFNLSVVPVMADSSLFFGIASLILIIFSCFRSRSQNKQWLIFCGLWFLLFLSTSFLSFDKVPYFLEHRLYLPLIGFLFFLIGFERVRNFDFKKRNSKVIVLSILLLFSLITVFQSRHFSDRLTFWQTAAKDSPHSPLARRNLGAMYYLDGDYQKAEREYSAALAINAAEPMVNNNLGLIYMNQGNFWQAEIKFRKELAINPYYDKALFNLGNLYYQEGKFLEARELWQETLRVNPAAIQAQEGLNVLANKLN